MRKNETQAADMDAADPDKDPLRFEISDAELERAVGTGVAAFTLGNCTGLGSCPA
jgi:hypothetical protein